METTSDYLLNSDCRRLNPGTGRALSFPPFAPSSSSSTHPYSSHRRYNLVPTAGPWYLLPADELKVERREILIDTWCWHSVVEEINDVNHQPRLGQLFICLSFCPFSLSPFNPKSNVNSFPKSRLRWSSDYYCSVSGLQ